MLEQAVVIIGTNGVEKKRWTCSVARTYAELAAGLSNVASMLPDVGMLFVLPSTQIITVVTSDMLFPLDVIFIGEDLAVTEVVQNLPPGTSVASSSPCTYFLEVNASETEGIVAGDDVQIMNTDIPVTPSIWHDISDVILPGLIMVGMLSMANHAMGGKSSKSKRIKK